jgi:hypothetical protein
VNPRTPTGAGLRVRLDKLDTDGCAMHVKIATCPAAAAQ